MKQLYVFYCGMAKSDKGTLTYHVDKGKIIDVNFSAYLIKTDQGNVLFEAGIDHEDIPYLLTTGRKLDIKKEEHFITQLKQVGVSPEQVKMIVMSHLHWDHCGLLKAFPNAEIVIQRDEYRYAMQLPDFARHYYRTPNYDSPKLKWRLIDGDEVLQPGIIAVATPGHTPGHQSLLVELPETGAVILTGDCANMRENIDNMVISGIFVDPVQSLHSLKKLKMLQQLTKAKIFYGHDLELYKTMKKVPDCYK